MTQPSNPRSEPPCGRGFDSGFGNLTGAGKQMGLMSVSGNNQGWKTCVQVYNPAGFSMEFAMVRNSSQRFDCVPSIVVWCGVLPHQHPQGLGLSPGPFFCPKSPCHVGFWPSVLRVAISRNARNRPLSLPEPSLFSVWPAGRRSSGSRKINNLHVVVHRQPRRPVTSATRQCASFVLTLRQLF